MDWFRELQVVSATPLDVHNQRKRDDDQRVQASLGQQVLTPQDPVQETLTRGNAWLLGAGDHGGFNLKAPYGFLQGVPGSIIKDSNVTLEAEGLTIEGVIFLASAQQSANAGALVSVTSGTVVFTHCLFLKPQSGTQSGDFVIIADGAKAIFIGCQFGPTQANGQYAVNHLGAVATDVGIIGCSNKTGLAHNNVTTVFEVT